MIHPFEWINKDARKYVFWVLFALTIVVMVAEQKTGKPLITEKAPSGIVSFELAGSGVTARAIVQSWGPSGRAYAALNLGIDYLFLFLYAVTIGLGSVLVAGLFKRGFLYNLGIIFSWLILVAGGLDAVENYALIKILFGPMSDGLAVTARWCAIPKFTIVALSLIYLLISLAGYALFRKRYTHP